MGPNPFLFLKAFRLNNNNNQEEDILPLLRQNRCATLWFQQKDNANPRPFEGWIERPLLIYFHYSVENPWCTIYHNADDQLHGLFHLPSRLTDFIATFLRFGADPLQESFDGETPLDVAKRCYPEIIAVVKKHMEEQKSNKRGHSTSPIGQGL